MNRKKIINNKKKVLLVLLGISIVTVLGSTDDIVKNSNYYNEFMNSLNGALDKSDDEDLVLKK